MVPKWVMSVLMWMFKISSNIIIGIKMRIVTMKIVLAVVTGVEDLSFHFVMVGYKKLHYFLLRTLFNNTIM